MNELNDLTSKIITLKFLSLRINSFEKDYINVSLHKNLK